jgi:iron complex outermembrane receptor protein
MSPHLRWLQASRTRAQRVSVTILSTAAIAVSVAAPLSSPRAEQAANETKGDLPPISVEQAAPKPKSTVSKAKKSNATAKPQQPATAGDGGETQATATVAAGTRSGSLTVPNTAEARAEIDRTPGGVDLVSDKAYKTSTPASTIKDALDYVPGVFVQTKWGDDTRLSIRGSGLSRNFHGRGITLLMDGIIPISTADGASDFQEIDPTAYRYIEVYKGSNALRFGANSLGGALNFVMPTGYDADLFGARVDVGSFGFHKLAASSGGVYGAADYFITGTWQEQDGFRDHSEGQSARAAMNVGYRLSPDVETRFYLNANHVRQNIPGAVTKSAALTNPEGAFQTNINQDYERNLDTLRTANRTTLRLAPGTFVEVGGFYFNRHLDHPIFNVLDYRHNELGGFARIVDEERLGGFKNRFIAGVNLHHGDIDARQFQNLAGNKGNLAADATQLSRNTVVYGENSFFVLPTVAFVGGAQYVYASREQIDHFLSNGNSSGEADFDFWSPKAGVLWDVTPSAQVFANVSRSGETPTFSEVTITTISITSLKVQEATTYEIGTRGSQPGFTWDLALYRSEIDNEFQCLSLPATPLGTCTQINLDHTIHQGIELGVGAALWTGIFETIGTRDKLWLNAAYTLSDFRFDGDAKWGDNELPGAPRHYLRAELLYKHPSGIYLGPNVEWVPEAFYVDSANTLSTEAYAIWGAKLGFDDGGPITAYVEGRNLADEAYISSASIANTATKDSALFEPGTGRSVYAGIQYKW